MAIGEKSLTVAKILEEKLGSSRAIPKVNCNPFVLKQKSYKRKKLENKVNLISLELAIDV